MTTTSPNTAAPTAEPRRTAPIAAATAAAIEPMLPSPATVEPVTHPVVARTVKRAIDLVGAAIVLVVASPVLLVAAVGIKLTSKGPIVFRQQRTGRGGVPFTMYKLRTFPVEHQDVRFSTEHRDCPLPFGRVLRRTSIDELPQLVNVLKGDMSLVGPRPERVPFAERFCVEVPGYRERFRVRGGLTGLAQVSGMVGNTSIPTRTGLDNEYIDTWSLATDVRILARTLPAVLHKIHD